jgi:hypothetical protein
MPKHQMDPDILTAALQGLEAQRERITAHIAEIRRLLDSRRESTAATPAPSLRKRTMTAAARRRIARAQKKRWAAFRKAQAPAKKATVAKPRKRRISAAGRKRIAEAARKRWAELRKRQAQQAASARKTPPKHPAAKKIAVKAARKGSAKRAEKPTPRRPQKPANAPEQAPAPEAAK